MSGRWFTDPQYSHGYLVPAFSLVLLYLRRGQLRGAELRPDWRGLALLTVGALGYVAGAYVHFEWISAVSLLPSLAGIVLLAGGVPALRWSWPAVGFLVFMIPLPYRIEVMLGHPLQRIATLSSTWLLQTAGFPAFGEGNVIVLENGRIAVVEACSGLSMLLTFAAITTGMAILLKRPLLDRIVIVLSTIPIALAVNIVRISLNGVVMEWWNADIAHRMFHDQGGWMMMPLAIGLVWLEVWVLGRLLVEPALRRPAPAGRPLIPPPLVRTPAG
jgi:exosortase